MQLGYHQDMGDNNIKCRAFSHFVSVDNRPVDDPFVMPGEVLHTVRATHFSEHLKTKALYETIVQLA